MRNNLCVGLDFSGEFNEYIDFISLVDAGIYKINPAFVSDKNIKLLAQYLNHRDIYWIYDAKLGDVYNTNISYARYVFEELGAPAVTLNPYVGFESLEPFIAYKNKQCFILCKTTHEGADTFQLPEKVIKYVKDKPNLGIVYAGNDEAKLKLICNLLPKNNILAPGIGAQGGEIKIWRENLIYSVSRSIFLALYPDVAYQTYLKEIYRAQLSFKLNNYIKSGDFILSSGERSDFYIDLKAVTGDIDLFKVIVYLLSDEVSSESIIGIASGSISYATAVAQRLNLSFGFVRKEAKLHGMRVLVEGLTDKTKPVTIIEDVVSTGDSLEKAIAEVRNEGFIVSQAIAIVNRSSSYECSVPFKSLFNLF